MKKPMTQTELELLRQIDDHKGTLELDLSDELHYRYYMDSMGGEAHVRMHASRLYEMIQYRRNLDLSQQNLSDLSFLGESAPIQLEDYNLFTNTAVEPRHADKSALRGEASDCYNVITNTFEASYASRPVACLNVLFQFCDVERREWINRFEETLYPDQNHTFVRNLSVPIEATVVERERTYRTIAMITTLSPTSDNRCLLTPIVTSTTNYSISTKNDIQEIRLLDPLPINAGGRTHDQENVCVAYNRSGIMQSPDYCYDVPLSRLISNMPVRLPFSLTVELRNDAYFRTDKNGSYLCGSADPDVHLTRFDDASGLPISQGRAHLYMDWSTFSSSCIQVMKTNSRLQATKLKLRFPTDWECQLGFEKLIGGITYADFYAMLSFNTCNKTSLGSYVDQTTSVFVRYLPDADRHINPTKPGENSIHAARMLYQWGCLGKDTLLIGEDGPVRACDVSLHDRLLSRGGRWIEVQDIHRGVENEGSILRIVHERGDILVTPDHTLFDETLTPLAAKHASAGGKLIYLDTRTMQEEAVAILSVETIPYDDRVYNFEFLEPEYLIADGLVVGDYGWQQKIRPCDGKTAPVPLNRATEEIVREFALLCSALRKPDTDLPGMYAPVFSNRSECMTLHYFAIKTLACLDGLYTEKEAQTIAEYCQYIGDNACIGALMSTSVPTEIDEAGLATLILTEEGDPRYLVPVIPTAMAKWYDDSELSVGRSWSSPDSIPNLQKTPVVYRYDTAKDILGPFHYPFCTDENEEGTEYLSDGLRRLMDGVKRHCQAIKEPDQTSLIAIGIVLHLMLDSLLHERFYPSPDWRNLARMEQVLAPDGSDITGSHKPYYPGGAPFPDEPYDPDKIYPTGIQENGDASQCSYARYCYRFPLSPMELDLGGAFYTGYKNISNAPRYVRGCRQALQFLTDCRAGARFDETRWNKIIAPALEDVFSRYTENPKDIQSAWRAKFADVSYAYNADEVFYRLLIGDAAKNSDRERYEEFFRFTLLADRIRKGEELL